MIESIMNVSTNPYYRSFMIAFLSTWAPGTLAGLIYAWSDQNMFVLFISIASATYIALQSMSDLSFKYVTKDMLKGRLIPEKEWAHIEEEWEKFQNNTKVKD